LSFRYTQVGRIYARGKSFIPNIKRDLHDQIHAEVVRSQKEFERSRAEQVAASPAAPEGDSRTATAPADVTILPPLPSRLPQNWESIAVGNMVLADEGPGEGFWQAIVIARDNEILTLRYRDYPKVPKFETAHFDDCANQSKTCVASLARPTPRSGPRPGPSNQMPSHRPRFRGPSTQHPQNGDNHVLIRHGSHTCA
jgi:hypothetical protein